MEWFTDAPVMIVRDIAAWHGCGFYPAGIGEPTWAETVLEGRPEGVAKTMLALSDMGFRVEPEGRAAVGNPTFMLAAQSISRSRGGSSAPAAAYAR